jgi:transcriptional regulator with XRE-family HTH domain
MRRMMLGLSQEKLAHGLGLTFQQVQKYEKGANRIGASRLQQIATILQVPVAFFFEKPGVPGLLAAAGSESPAYLDEFVTSRDGLSIAKDFPKLTDKQRRAVVALVGSMAA